ncbi:uncharacterized protein UV8b_04339 [Ustilaginoidea virens]|uniref:Uncharacterized protein n=1 Tax=Ustilaginoidea virens TaxID=1159556 RepID=A0A8E5HRE1_USTVR|nr:uncharacterized protein UV8b_04339 [Ustilaginoidea virens]QUC20098.1 hypothetical protein UV8b_04339 [Ustilaginoidea virens]
MLDSCVRPGGLVAWWPGGCGALARHARCLLAAETWLLGAAKGDVTANERLALDSRRQMADGRWQMV